MVEVAGQWSAIIVAAGRGTRMGTHESKQYLQLVDKPILVHTLEQFAGMSFVQEIILVVGELDVDRCKQWIDHYQLDKVKAVVCGGAERQDSVYEGLLCVSNEWVMVHDGVRPLVTEEAVRRGCAAAEQHGASVLAVPVKDTIKQVDHTGKIIATPDRKSLWAIQTPQAFRCDQLIEAHEDARDKGFLGTDDAMLIERMGSAVYVVEGEYTNIKITTPEDLPMAQMLLADLGRHKGEDNK